MGGINNLLSTFMKPTKKQIEALRQLVAICKSYGNQGPFVKNTMDEDGEMIYDVQFQEICERAIQRMSK